jgi:hypothetical protein
MALAMLLPYQGGAVSRACLALQQRKSIPKHMVAEENRSSGFLPGYEARLSNDVTWNDMCRPPLRSAPQAHA